MLPIVDENIPFAFMARHSYKDFASHLEPTLFQAMEKSSSKEGNSAILGWFQLNPFEKYESKWESSPNRGENKKYLYKDLWNRHPENNWVVSCWYLVLTPFRDLAKHVASWKRIADTSLLHLGFTPFWWKHIHATKIPTNFCIWDLNIGQP